MHRSRMKPGSTSSPHTPLTSASDQSQYGKPMLPSLPKAMSARLIALGAGLGWVGAGHGEAAFGMLPRVLPRGEGAWAGVVRACGQGSGAPLELYEIGPVPTREALAAMGAVFRELGLGKWRHSPVHDSQSEEGRGAWA